MADVRSRGGTSVSLDRKPCVSEDDFGFEFEGRTVYSLLGDTIGRGTYSIDGSTGRICLAIRGSGADLSRYVI